MDKSRKKSSYILGMVFVVIMALEICFAADLAFIRAEHCLSGKTALFICLSALAIGTVLNFAVPRIFNMGFALLQLLLMLAAIALGLIWLNIYRLGTYPQGEADKAQVFAGKRVLAVVPRPGDEQMLLGGVLEQYERYGSQVWVAYLTNGDSEQSAEQSYREAAAALSRCGVEQSETILLGYGESLAAGEGGIYFQPEDEVQQSAAGRSSTYGVQGHMPFKEGRDYTKYNMQQDIKDLILRYTPDVIYCSDYDRQPDHQALSLMFDRAMGQVLKAKPNYHPLVLKGFIYPTAYAAEQDFYAVNIAATKDPWGESLLRENGAYAWENRLRLPVAEESLSRSILPGSSYKAFACYASRDMAERAAGIANGDRVFWQRETDSILGQSELFVSSGNKKLLGDFMLGDTLEPLTSGQPMEDGLWCPDPEDGERRIIIKFQIPRDISRLVLYDAPSAESNILDAAIRFDDGSFVKTGALEPKGSPTEIKLDKRQVKEMEIQIMDSQGPRAGLAELEIFEHERQTPFSFVKICNSQGDFVYDYYMDSAGTDSFRIYTYGCDPELSGYKVLCIGEGCSAAAQEDGSIKLSCPEDSSCTLTVMDSTGSISDTVYIHNKDARPIALGQALERHVREELLKGYKKSVSWRLLGGLIPALGGNDT